MITDKEGAGMKKILYLILFFLIITCMTLSAQGKGLGLGVIVGEPTGVSAKLWTANGQAFDAAAAWSFIDDSAFYVHVNYLFHFADLISVKKGELPFYAGIGGKVKFVDPVVLGIRFPFGLEYFFAKVPLGIFLEIAPCLVLYPGSDFDIGAGLGVRYYIR